uniref:Uncharacterized protein n=1 Tax=Setaria italica TaxID=4555 RepID=K4APB6_SETIT
MSVLYRKDLVKLDGSDPMLLYGYGSYRFALTRVSEDPDYLW